MKSAFRMILEIVLFLFAVSIVALASGCGKSDAGSALSIPPPNPPAAGGLAQFGMA